MTRVLTPAGWALVALGILVLLTLRSCSVIRPSRDAARQTEASATLANGRTAAATDASAIRDGSDALKTQRDLTRKEATDASRNAPDDAAAGDAGLRGLCISIRSRPPQSGIQRWSPPRGLSRSRRRRSRRISAAPATGRSIAFRPRARWTSRMVGRGT